MKRFLYISISYATFAIESTENIVTLTPPIAKWMRGKSLQQIKPWLLKKKAKVIEIK